MGINNALDKFLLNYFSTKVNRHDGFLVYHHIPFGYLSETINSMKELINILELPLKVVVNNSGGMFQDSITIEAKDGVQ